MLSKKAKIKTKKSPRKLIHDNQVLGEGYKIFNINFSESFLANSNPKSFFDQWVFLLQKAGAGGGCPLGNIYWL